MRTNLLRLITSLIFLVGALVTLAACGDDRPTGTPSSSPPPTAKPKKADDPY